MVVDAEISQRSKKMIDFQKGEPITDWPDATGTWDPCKAYSHLLGHRRRTPSCSLSAPPMAPAAGYILMRRTVVAASSQHVNQLIIPPARVAISVWHGPEPDMAETDPSKRYGVYKKKSEANNRVSYCRYYVFFCSPAHFIV